MYYDTEQEIRILIMEIMIILYKYGITEVHMGGLMRLLGMEEEGARENDGEYVKLDSQFVRRMEQMVETPSTDNETIH